MSSLNYEDLIPKILDESRDDTDKFEIIKAISTHINDPNFPIKKKNNLIIALLSQKEKYSKYEIMINSLVRAVGLFPYLDRKNLSERELIAYEFHRPDGLEDIVFHRAQYEVYNELIHGNNVILSAPTSFGKSLIIDAIIISKKYKNIVLIVPTIALIEETRKRVSSLNHDYKLITHSSQKIEDANIFILTQERVIEFLDLDNIKIDFFVIDEFYKIDIDTDSDRSTTLNQAFYKLYNTGANFYLLGPNISKIEDLDKIKAKFIHLDYNTVYTKFNQLSHCKTKENKFNRILELDREIKEPTLIYCQSPRSVNDIALFLLKNGNFPIIEGLRNSSEWMKRNFHDKWIFPNCLERGIGLHHSRLPRSLSQYCVKLFNDKKLKYLICTSTLIEGVNTSAKNVIIFDNKIAQNNIDFFTYNNIIGRSGRMKKYFIGNVYLFTKPPEEELPTVDFPIFTQPKDMPHRLILQMKEDDLNSNQKHVFNYYKEQKYLEFDTIKNNSAINPEDQIKLAQKIKTDLKNNYFLYHNLLYWHYSPNKQQMKYMCDLIYEYFIKEPIRTVGIHSGSDLQKKIFKTIKYSTKENIDYAVKNFQRNDIEKINKSIMKIFEFEKNWANYKVPTYINALYNIQKDILGTNNKEYGDYSHFISQIESYNLDPTLLALEEYGIPIQVSKKIQNLLEPNDDLDEVILNLKKINIDSLYLDPFEKEIIKITQETLP